VNISVGSHDTIMATIEGSIDNQCNINIPEKNTFNTNHSKLVETDQTNTGNTLTNSLENAENMLEELVENKAKAVAREDNIIPEGRKEKARSWVKLKSGLYGWKKNPASSSRSKHTTIPSKNQTQILKANRSTLKTDQMKSEKNTHTRLADILPGAAAIGQGNSQSQGSI
jgi:CO dehydrogenase/acetyl-CoA synthase alpha subunit